MVGRTSKERTGYATQKPLELMRRIISASSEEGDLVGDFFCGSGSFVEAAEAMGRRWVGCDNEELATAMVKNRLDLIEANYTYRTETEQPLRHGRVVVTVNGADVLENGKKMFSCSIDGFVPDIETGYIQLNDRQYIEDAIETNTLQFIDYVMIDPDYTDNFSCEIVVENEFDDIRFLTHGRAAMVVVDVFGREYFTHIIQ